MSLQLYAINEKCLMRFRLTLFSSDTNKFYKILSRRKELSGEKFNKIMRYSNLTLSILFWKCIDL